MNKIRVEFHFYKSAEIAVIIDKSAFVNIELEKTGEILLFAAVVLRNLDNVGFNPLSREVAGLVSAINEDNIFELLKLTEEEPETVPYRGEGKQRFIGTLNFDFDKNYARMIWKYKGFGFFKRNLVEYGLGTGLVLLSVLGQKRIDDKEYITWLGKTAHWCGDAFLSGRVGIGREMNYITAAGNIVKWVGALPGHDAIV